ncbi:SigB/SigF/SigG family RNA polymerase sigma factor [Streptomyces sp. NPDC001380]|uniref:SigB/SigF/SigG family RNA polymerase sigma factor n=1 Tax=Streptomyces sp. NPDC001380 TaxID=3364566 RepID=UPI0036B5C255
MPRPGFGSARPRPGPRDAGRPARAADDRSPADLPERLRRLAGLPAGPERDRLREQVIASLMPMARRLARRFRNRGESDDDLLQVASVGLVKAVDRYDPEQGHAFESFAVPTIVGELKRHFRDHAWDLHVPRRVQEARNQVRRAQQELLQPLGGRSPTVAEVADYTGLAEEDVILGLEAYQAYAAVSLDAPVPGLEAGSLADTMGAEDRFLDLVVDRISLRPLLEGLPERERRILFLRFFRSMTQHQIADVVGVSQMHVSRLIARSCATLRSGMLAGV